MVKVVQDRRVLLAVGGLLMAVLGAVVTLGFSAAIGGELVAADQVSLIYTNGDRIQNVPPVHLPLTVEAAKSAGWSDSDLCHNRWGRPFGRFEVDYPDPLMLMYSAEGQLVGINLFSLVEQPLPWEYLDKGITTALPGRDAAHWSLSIYVIDPLESRTCSKFNVQNVGMGAYG
jgi:hypothetical protein